MKKVKKHSLPWWKRKAKATFQKFIRLRDSDENGFCKCCTCGRTTHYKKMNGGHFIPTEWLSTCFIEHNCHAQCVYCNKGLQGNTDSYWVFMEKKYGREAVDQLIAQKHLNVKHSYSDYQEIIEIYTDKINGLEIQKGLL